jgi:hypothetical protein
MNLWTNQMSAQIVNRMQREGVEVVESPFEREWQPGPISRLILAVWQALAGWVRGRMGRRLTIVEIPMQQG